MSNQETPIRESFVFYRSFYESISRCPDDVQQILLRAVINYGLNQVVPDFSGVPFQPFVEAIFAGIRPQLDANHKRFLNGCKGGEFGRLGGAPKGNTNARKDKQPLNNPKTTPNVNENDNVNGKMSLRGQRKHNDKPLVFPFTDSEFIDTWKELVSQPKWRGKTNTALQKTLNKLSGYDVRFAVALMNTAIENNYQGVVYPDTPAKYEQWKRNHPTTDQAGEPVITDIGDLFKD